MTEWKLFLLSYFELIRLPWKVNNKYNHLPLFYIFKYIDDILHKCTVLRYKSSPKNTVVFKGLFFIIYFMIQWSNERRV